MKVGPISIGGGGRGPEGGGGGGRPQFFKRPEKGPQSPKVEAPKVEAQAASETPPPPDHRSEQADILQDVGEKKGPAAVLQGLGDKSLPPNLDDAARDAQMALQADAEASRRVVTDADVVAAGESGKTSPEPIDPAVTAVEPPESAGEPPDPVFQAAKTVVDHLSPEQKAQLMQELQGEVQASSGAGETPVDTAAQAEAERAAAERRTNAYMEITQAISDDIDPNADPRDILNRINSGREGDARWKDDQDTINYIKGAQQFKSDKLAAEASAQQAAAEAVPAQPNTPVTEPTDGTPPPPGEGTSSPDSVRPSTHVPPESDGSTASTSSPEPESAEAAQTQKPIPDLPPTASREEIIARQELQKFFAQPENAEMLSLQLEIWAGDPASQEAAARMNFTSNINFLKHYKERREDALNNFTDPAERAAFEQKLKDKDPEALAQITNLAYTDTGRDMRRSGEAMFPYDRHNTRLIQFIEKYSRGKDREMIFKVLNGKIDGSKEKDKTDELLGKYLAHQDAVVAKQYETTVAGLEDPKKKKDIPIMKLLGVLALLTADFTLDSLTEGKIKMMR